MQLDFCLPTKRLNEKKHVFSSHQSKHVLIDLHFASDTVNKKHHGPNPTLIELIGAGLNKAVALTTNILSQGLPKFSHCSVEQNESSA